MENPDDRLAKLSELERTAVEDYVESYIQSSRIAPPEWRDCPDVASDGQLRQNALRIILDLKLGPRFSKYVAQYEKRLAEQRYLLSDDGSTKGLLR